MIRVHTRVSQSPFDSIASLEEELDEPRGDESPGAGDADGLAVPGGSRLGIHSHGGNV